MQEIELEARERGVIDREGAVSRREASLKQREAAQDEREANVARREREGIVQSEGLRKMETSLRLQSKLLDKEREMPSPKQQLHEQKLKEWAADAEKRKAEKEEEKKAKRAKHNEETHKVASEYVSQAVVDADEIKDAVLKVEAEASNSLPPEFALFFFEIR